MDAQAYLIRHGWTGPGNPLNPNRRPGTHGGLGLTRPLLISRRENKVGIGKKSNKDPTNQWWLRGFEEALRGVGQDGVATSAGSEGNSLTRNGSELYKFFVRGEVIPGTLEGVGERLATEVAAEEPEKKKKSKSEKKRKRGDGQSEDNNDDDGDRKRKEEKRKKRKLKDLEEAGLEVDKKKLKNSKKSKERETNDIDSASLPSAEVSNNDWADVRLSVKKSKKEKKEKKSSKEKKKTKKTKDLLSEEKYPTPDSSVQDGLIMTKVVKEKRSKKVKTENPDSKKEKKEKRKNNEKKTKESTK
ncbi:hypothetical protein BGW36DRAFT_376790 [Talaromyces proteolyticus]|uniref:G-patch domain-containing protein n=1 Tax=Talaromyces proteolyticus TaxID=1131652 RepID=A0AAD4Q1R2_9EURO|nr:uncharacterized protein BGW36DRAFT_376790 [Talaromyces proteolyticus]KAH8698818.1 hypothetical protein BGW36DRAFT_376790 [Talaromyces proteolyticus]